MEMCRHLVELETNLDICEICQKQVGGNVAILVQVVARSKHGMMFTNGLGILCLLFACKGSDLSIGKEYRLHSVVRNGEVVTQEEDAHEPPALAVERTPLGAEKRAIESLSESLGHRAIAVKSGGSLEIKGKKEGGRAPELGVVPL